MCEDYAVGVEALRRWERATDPKRAMRIAELRDSLAELEVEILEVLMQKGWSDPTDPVDGGEKQPRSA